MQRPSGAGEHGEHRAVLAEHLGGEPFDAVGSGEGGEMFEEQRGDAEPLMSIVDHERRVGVIAASPPLVTRPTEQLAM